ncbi:hypothetical protein CAAN1_06S06414 [[Candida] anglica]|uniref:C2H2-type domain-containing protein n=1 Tax=[Candida] anglica TaxID=148631 RepID=A0ABP0EM73_9ASCO
MDIRYDILSPVARAPQLEVSKLANSPIHSPRKPDDEKKSIRERISQLPAYLETPELELHDELRQLKEESTQRFKSTWAEIIDRYSKIDDEKESDVLDLATGAIIVDNGHLRSLGPGGAGGNSRSHHGPDSNIWSATFDWKEQTVTARKQEQNEIRRKRLIPQSNVIEKANVTEGIHINKPDLQPDPISHQSKDCDDNILLLTPSPSKKAKLGQKHPTISVPPISTRENGSPRGKSADYNSESSKMKPDSEDIPIRTMPLHLPSLNESFGSLDEFIVADVSDSDYDSNMPKPSYLFSDSGSDVKDSEDEDPEPIHIVESLDEVSNDSFMDKTIPDTPIMEDRSGEFDEIYSIASNLLINNTKKPIYTCAIPQCHYRASYKSQYQSHLLDEHSSDLYIAGYQMINPVAGTEYSTVFLDTKTISRLNEDFPILWETPPLPFTPTGEPIICNSPLPGGTFCKKPFLSKHEFELHCENIPAGCSSKKQVLICPVLGCGYITDEGYLQWREHFITAKHHHHASAVKSPTEGARSLPEVYEVLSSSEEEIQASDVDEHQVSFDIPKVSTSGYESIDELFSDG